MWVPPEVAYTGPIEKNGWISTDHAVRNGPRSMKIKFNVMAAYPTFQKFFEDQLVVARCSDDILLKECQALEGNKEITRKEKLHRVCAILNDICEALLDPDRAKAITSWLPALASLRVLPATTPAGEVKFKTAVSKFFIPDANRELADLFRDKCILLHSPKELPLLRLKPLLSFKAFSDHVQDLEAHVKVRATIVGDTILLQDQSREFSGRIHYIRR